MAKTLKTRILLRNDTQANWKAADVVLAKGEAAVSIDLVPALFKIGDGTKKWSELKYIGVAKDDFDNLATDVTGLKNKVTEITQTGGEPNTIEAVQLNGVTVAPDAEKKVNLTVAEGTANGTIAVNGSDVHVHGLEDMFDAKGAADAVVGKDGDVSTANTIYGVKKYADEKISAAVASVLVYKGTKEAVADLPAEGNIVGDVWHVNADGSERAWDGTAWQELGTAIDTSGFATKDDLATETAAREELGTSVNTLSGKVTALEGKATNVEASETNGAIKVDGKEVTVYNIEDEAGLILDGGSATE